MARQMYFLSDEFNNMKNSCSPTPSHHMMQKKGHNLGAFSIFTVVNEMLRCHT